MEPQEADTLAAAAQKVARHYDIQATQKAIDIAGFMSVLSWSYGSRLAAMAMRQRLERGTAQQSNGGNGADMTAPEASGGLAYAHIPQPIATH